MCREKIIGIFLLSLFFSGCGETQDSYYDNIDAARKEGGAIEGGWIPHILPESSYDIYERHNIDSNLVWLRFKFDIKDIKRLIDQIQEINPAEIGDIEFISPGRVKWWPQNLNKESFKDKQSSLRIYRYDRVITYADNRQKIVPSFFVIDWNSNIAYYWWYGL